MIRRALALVAAMLLVAGCHSRSRDGDTVLLWHAYTGDERAALEQQIDAFNAEHDDVSVALVSVPYKAFADKLSNAIPNGNGPDLFIFAHDRIGDWAETGLVEPIEFYVDEPTADRFAYDAIAAMAYRRSLYGLPMAVKSVALFYRTDVIDAPPRTTDELWAMGRAVMNERGGHALAYVNADLYGHAAWLHGFGGHIFGADGELDVATAEATRAAEFAQQLGRELVPPETTATMVATLFNEGKAAMAISGPWFVGDIAEGVPWKVTTLPVVSETGLHAAPFLGAEGVLMSSRARDKRRAFQVMQYLTSDASAIARARAAGQVVPNHAAYEEPDIGGDPVLGAFKAQLEHTVPMPASPEMRMVWTPYKTALQNVIAQGAGAGSALVEAEREIRSYLREGE